MKGELVAGGMAVAETTESGSGSGTNWRALRLVAGEWEDMEEIRHYKKKHGCHPHDDLPPGRSRPPDASYTSFLDSFAKDHAFAVAEELLDIDEERIVVPEGVGYWDRIDESDYETSVGGYNSATAWENVEELLRDASLGHQVRYGVDYRPVVDVMKPSETALQREYEKRRRQDRDMKVIIYARDGATGTGKTSLAVELAKSWDVNGWSAEKATLDPSQYVQKWHEVPEGSVIVADEAEQQADSRRSMSKQNLSLTHAWATLRYQQVFSVLTLPDPTYLDVRLRKGADFHIVVHERGRAVVYRSKIEDQSGELYQERCHTIRWDPIDDDPDYQELNRMKAERMEEYRDQAYFEDDDTPTKEEIETARIEGRNEVIRQMAAAGDTHKEIAQTVGLDRSTVSKIVSEG